MPMRILAVSLTAALLMSCDDPRAERDGEDGLKLADPSGEVEHEVEPDDPLYCQSSRVIRWRRSTVPSIPTPAM